MIWTIQSVSVEIAMLKYDCVGGAVTIFYHYRKLSLGTSVKEINMR